VTPESRLLGENRPARLILYGGIAAGFFAAVALVAQTLVLASIVDRVFLGGQTRQPLVPLFAVMMALLLARSACLLAAEVLGQRAGSRVKARLRSMLAAKLLVLGPGFTAGERSGELVNLLGSTLESVDAYVTGFLPARALAVATPLFVLGVVLLLDPPTTLVYLVAGPFLILLLGLIGRRTADATERRFHELNWLSAHFLDMLQGLPTLKLFGRSREQATNIEEISRRHASTTMEVLRTAFQTSFTQELAATAATALVALEVSLRLMDGRLAFANALAVLLLTPEFFLPLRNLSLRYHAGTAGRAAAARVYELIDRTGGAAAAAGATIPTGDVAFEDVTFRYGDGREAALRDLSLVLREGQTLAVVGATGAGKSTAARLLLRFAEPDIGRITVGGRQLSEMDARAWRTRVAWVPQRPYLFNGSVADNLRLAKPHATDSELVDAARAANAHEFIAALPQGYATLLGEQGARLSGGQQQRIAIARAYLKDAPILILDEASASLDAAGEAAVIEALARLMSGRTVFVIAHRLELAAAADEVAVMEAGTVVEAGPPDLLAGAAGPYAQLLRAYGGVGVARRREVGA
jgi:ATP-binding cassette subfamily C protein CydD